MFRVARKWIAGYDQQAALACGQDANKRGMGAILNFLGEDTTDTATVSQTVSEYIALINKINRGKIRGCVSVKPTQVGLSIGYESCLQNYRLLIAKAKELGQFLWIDMESVKFTDHTIAIYLELLKEYKEIGIAIQSYLRRSAGDILHIVGNGGKIRLVKGAYHESEEHAFISREEIDANYSKLMRMLFDGGTEFFAVATHDTKLIEEAVQLFSDNPKASFEFQMLMGIRDELKPEFVAKGYRLSEYIPYGGHWLPYSVRRLRERKRNILLLAGSLLH